MVEWLLAAIVLLAALAVLPWLLQRSKAARRKSGGGSGVMIAIGIAFSMIFDAKASAATEQIARKNELGDAEEGESGEKP